MKILAIRVKNLASLEGVTEIDFTKEPLRSAGIFAITGPMGAGKSTLLDAICLALFSKTPRHLNARESGIELQDVANNKISQGDIKGILRKGCGDGYAEVEFVGIDGKNHKATWSVKRARNKIEGPLQPDTVELTNLTDNIKYPEKKTETLKEIERLVGLNFEQFTRSVLLAQGEFTAFLKADKDQKASLLEKLTGTDIYSEISKLIYEKYRVAEQEFKELQRQMEGISLLSADELLQFNEQKSALGNVVIKLEKESLSLIAEINWHQTLVDLTLGKNQAEVAFELSKKDKEDASERLTTFTIVEGVQSARGFFDAKAAIMDQLHQRSNELQPFLLEIQELNDKHSVAVEKLTEADTVVLKNENENKDARPLIDKAKELDTVIKEKKEQVKLAGIESADALTNMQEHIAQILGKENEIKTISKQLEELTIWKLENDSGKPIAENLPIIISKLDTASGLLLQEKKFVATIEANNANLKNADAAIGLFKKEVDQKVKTLDNLNAIHDTNETELSTIKIDDIKAIENRLIASLDEIVPAIGCWELLYSNQQEYDSIVDKLDFSNSEIISKKENLIVQDSDLKEAFVRKEQSQKILSQAELQTHEKVEDMRSQLVDGDPCPVCGSVHHPFTSNNPQLHQLLEGLKQEHAECTQNYNQLLKNCIGLENECEKLVVDCIGFVKEKNARAGKINELTKKWQAFKINEACLSLPAAERLTWLNNEEKGLRSDLKIIQDQSNAYQLLKDSTDQQKRIIYNNEKELATVKDKLKDAERDHQTLNAEIKRLGEELVICKGNIEVIASELDPYFTNLDWCSTWQHDPSSFEQEIKTFAIDWNEKIRSLELGTKNLEILNTELKGLQKQMESLEFAVANTAGKKAGLEDSLSNIQSQRKQIFNGDEIILVEQRLKKQIEEALKNLKDCKSEKDQLDATLIKANANIEQCGNDIDTCNKKAGEHGKQIKGWMDNYNSNNQSNLDEKSVITLLVYTSEWIATERKTLIQIDDAITRSKATFEERSLQLSTHVKKRLSDRSLENLESMQAEIKSFIDSAVIEKNDIEFKLRQDTENKKLLGSLEETIKIKHGIYENWQKLNELLGSADGKKFRQIAQEYTLDILLGFTNIHLQILANRYKLSRVPNSLALQVLDRDMGDEIRSVHSLSGGESFLVSLALALGLASLSSNRMKVESLFIDEGFGSLDQATLSIAMDALERLHDQGRKVGVISHVQEMTERIQTQIKISKISNGRSRVEVTSVLN